MQVNRKRLIDEGPCSQTVRELRWPDGMTGPACQAPQGIKRGGDDPAAARQRSACHDCEPRFADRTDTLLVGHQPPRKGWVVWLEGMGLHIANEQIAQEWALHGRDGHQRTPPLRAGIGKKSRP